VLVSANDVAVMGVRPRWFLATVLLPPGSEAAEVRALLAGVREALDRLGAVLVGGHSEVTAAVRQAVVVGQMLGFAEDGRWIPTGGLAAGDRVIQVGPAPVEGAAVLAAEAPAARSAAPELRARAEAALEAPGISVVEAALAAAGLGARALHDPTEGGLSAGLHELADASRVALRVDADAVLWFEPGLAVCDAVGCDPWGTLASGALLAGFAAGDAEAACAALRERGFAAAPVARAEEGTGVVLGDGAPLPRFDRDEVARVLAG
jgi:hydrogenase maturation factor